MQMPLTATCICLSILTSRVRHFWYISHEGISTNGQYNIQFINATFSMHQRLDCVSPSTSLTRSFASRVWALALLSSSVSAKQQLRKRLFSASESKNAIGASLFLFSSTQSDAHNSNFLLRVQCAALCCAVCDLSRTQRTNRPRTGWS